MITFLQHSDAQLPHYAPSKWTFARGALATIDRPFFGLVGPYILHGIAETHVAHHICSKIPHYNAWEATEALKTFLGPHYYKSEENFLVSFWRSSQDCQVSRALVPYPSWLLSASLSLSILPRRSLVSLLSFC